MSSLLDKTPRLTPFVFDPGGTWGPVGQIIRTFQDLGIFKDDQPNLESRRRSVDYNSRLFGGFDPGNEQLSPNYIFLSKITDGLGEQYLNYFGSNYRVIHGEPDYHYTESIDTTYALICGMCDIRFDSQIFFPLIGTRWYKWADGRISRPSNRQQELHEKIHKEGKDGKADWSDTDREDIVLRPAMPQEITAHFITKGYIDIASETYSFTQNRVVGLNKNK